jgi:hypothetical protein
MCYDQYIPNWLVICKSKIRKIWKKIKKFVSNRQKRKIICITEIQPQIHRKPGKIICVARFCIALGNS